MKLQSQVSRTIGEKKYIKYWVVIPPKIIKELGFEKGDIIKPKVINKKLIIENARNN